MMFHAFVASRHRFASALSDGLFINFISVNIHHVTSLLCFLLLLLRRFETSREEHEL
ncbi:hypothetical protein DEO72_LG6g383 [Vigna unguiculata]|uniref:Uncharacterized protein n=1 Tax=Vigna unguiculata TaxID=3917 RepID=A0A4D6M520_VIGUN|nr:hypothetical protein DEO72_LG6g383 [Vigna unguiculata]